MEANTLTTRNIAIEGMSGDVCVNKVTAALKGVADVTTRNVKVGSATIECDQDGCNAACAAIGAAGYKARENVRTGTSNGPMNTTQNPQAEPKAGIQTGTPSFKTADAPVSQMGSCGSTQKAGGQSEGEQCTPGAKKS